MDQLVLGSILSLASVGAGAVVSHLLRLREVGRQREWQLEDDRIQRRRALIDDRVKAAREYMKEADGFLYSVSKGLYDTAHAKATEFAGLRDIDTQSDAVSRNSSLLYVFDDKALSDYTNDLLVLCMSRYERLRTYIGTPLAARPPIDEVLRDLVKERVSSSRLSSQVQRRLDEIQLGEVKSSP